MFCYIQTKIGGIMFDSLKRFKVYLAIILATSVILFYGSYNSESTNNPAVPNSNIIDTLTLSANPGPSNNGGSAGWAEFFDLIGGPLDVTVMQMSTGSTAAASANFSVIVFTRSGTSLGGPGGPGSSQDGWTLLDTVSVVQGSTTSGISLVFGLPPIFVPAGDTVGVAIRFIGVGPRYFGTGTPPYSVYSDTNLTLKTGDGRSAPFTTTGSWFASRALTGVIRYIVGTATRVINTGSEFPDGFKLAQNYPNPFNPSTNIRYEISKNSFIKLTVFDALGREIETLVNEKQSPGTYEEIFNATQYPSGVYFYRLTTNKFSDTKKMILMK
jgi:hypothetical protein